ncbi:peroxiredoxin [uncultured Kordia sp.]|uniref:peroxiredoxin family protein n=1 Tax=uncultured Kordia sp. TaxID=507699 RepID=UPI0026022D67|nr:redoxin domain-containing protein [uncultured Kordia sp.]
MSNTVEDNNIFKAPEFNVNQWVDGNGNSIKPVQLSDFKGNFKIIYCFQSWCPGCHSQGFPSLKKMVTALQDHPKITFLAIQTVFEGFEANTYEKMLETQQKYGIHIPFGHDAGNDGKSTSNMMNNYKTRGTPWFIFIDKHDNVVFENFHLNADAAIDFLKGLPK